MAEQRRFVEEREPVHMCPRGQCPNSGCDCGYELPEERVHTESASANCAHLALANLVGFIDMLLSRDDLPPLVRESLINNWRIVEARAVLDDGHGFVGDGPNYSCLICGQPQDARRTDETDLTETLGK